MKKKNNGIEGNCITQSMGVTRNEGGKRVNVTTWKETSPKGWVMLSHSRRGVVELLMEH